MRKRILTVAALVIVFIVVAGFALYWYSGVRMMYVPTGSMMNTVVPGDRIVGRPFSGPAKRGQVIVFKYPGDETLHISRVVGLSGETITMRDTIVYINDQPLPEERVVATEDSSPEKELKENSTAGGGPYRVFYTEGTSQFEMEEAVKIPANHVFVLGDHRNNSEDSRFRGTVPRELIWGEAFVIYFSTTLDTDEFRSGRFMKRIK